MIERMYRPKCLTLNRKNNEMDNHNFSDPSLALAGCGKDKQSTNELITVDVTKNYPEKELTLQDFMDVEYIPLETNDEFVTQGKVMAIGAEVILITNWANDGNLFVFDRKTGKALKKINRKGQGGEEYVGITEIVLMKQTRKYLS